MILIVPYSTDAPLYHYPIVTGGVIAANVAMYFATTFQAEIGLLQFEQIEWLMIQFNQINPLQWLTGSFMHLSFLHLLGNMLFLFCFGLVVEGKAGNLRFLAIYLSSCMLIGAVAQIPMFLMGSDEMAAGASGAISTLMVIALFWAPENEISIFYWFLIVFAGTTEVQILSLSIYFVAMDLITLVFTGFSMSGAMGHTIGALMGIPIALYYLRTDKIDCENWDLISRNEWLQQYPILYGEKQQRRDQDKHDDIENPVETALALTGGDVSKSRTIGIAPTRPKKTKEKASRNVPASKAKGTRKRKRKPGELSPEQIAEKCQAHPEFNRLAFVFRQSLQANNLQAAQQTFLRIDSLKLGLGLGETVLMDFATKLAGQKHWGDSIRPFILLIEKRGVMADDACLRLAQIQLRVLKRNDLAIATLKKITAPEETESVDPGKQLRLQKRDEMLAMAGGT